MLQVLDSDELDLPFNDLTLFRDIEGSEELYAEPWGFRKAYQAAMQTFLAEVRDACGQRGIDHLLLRTDEDLATAPELLPARPRAVANICGLGNRRWTASAFSIRCCCGGWRWPRSR